MGIEILVAWPRGRRVYRLGDAVSSSGRVALSQVTGIVSKLVFLGVYVLVYEHARLWDLPAGSVRVWGVALLLYDFLYYWHHRMGHEVAVLWAAHVVHHQSEDFNLSTALRQTSSGFLFGWIFYLPMAFAGFPPLVFVVVGLIDLLYQYWIHTEQVGRLGWFDRVFASPSNHRVHHAVNDVYLDKNYGGILILWDRRFGSYIDEDEKEPVVYGTRSPLRSYNPLWANVEVYAALARDAWHAQRWSDKLRLWLKPPGWRPDDLKARFPKPDFDISTLRKYDPPLSRGVAVYVLIQFVVLTAAGTFCLAVTEAIGTAWTLAYIGWLTLALCSLGFRAENRSAAMIGELLAIAVMLGVLGFTQTWFGTALAPAALWVLAAIGLAWLI